MKLLRQLYNENGGSAGGDNNYSAQSNLPTLIQQANGTPDAQANAQINYSGYTPPNLTPEETALYNKSQPQATTGALGLHDYYPGAGHQVGVGNYSGNEIGSATLFAPGGALVPLGMMDARDAAAQKAALHKMKEADDWKKRYANAPETKLVNVQKRLSDDYHGFIGDAWKQAMVKAGNDPYKAHKILDNDPKFHEKETSFRDLAKFDTALSDQFAQDEIERKSGKMVETPSYQATKKAVLESANSNSPEFKNLGNNMRKMHLERDFNDVYNTATQHLFQQETGNAYPVDSPEYIKAYTTWQQNFTPEQVEGVKNTINDHYHGSDYFTPERNNKNIDDLMHSTRSKTTMSLHMKPSDKGDEDPYANAVPQTSATVNQTIPNTRAETSGTVKGGTRPVYMENVYNTAAKHQAQELSFALNPDIVSLEGKPMGSESGHIKGNVQQIGSFPYYKDQKRFLKPEEAEGLKKQGDLYGNNGIEWKPGAIVNLTPKTTDKGKVGKSESAFIPLGLVRNKVDKHFDDVIDKVEADAKAKNVKEEKAPAAKAETKAVTAPKEGETRQFKEGTGIFKDGKWQLKK